MKIENLEVLDPFKFEFGWKIIKTLDNGGKPDYFDKYDTQLKKTYSLFYKKKQLLNLDEGLKYKKTQELRVISSSIAGLKKNKIKDRKKLIHKMKEVIMQKNWKTIDNIIGRL